MEWKWKTFEEEKPEEGKPILYGNHRFVDVMLYNPAHPRMKEDGKLAYKNITHWVYVTYPPEVESESKWL